MPFVSGTSANVNRVPIAQIPEKIQNVTAEPSAACRKLKESVTMNTEIQLRPTTMPVAFPFTYYGITKLMLIQVEFKGYSGKW